MSRLSYAPTPEDQLAINRGLPFPPTHLPLPFCNMPCRTPQSVRAELEEMKGEDVQDFKKALGGLDDKVVFALCR